MDVMFPSSLKTTQTTLEHFDQKKTPPPPISGCEMTTLLGQSLLTTSQGVIYTENTTTSVDQGPIREANITTMLGS